MSHASRSRIRHIAIRNLRATILLGAALLGAPPLGTAAQTIARPIIEGQRYFLATHSFNVFIGPNRRTGEPGPLAALAEEAGIVGHENAGVQMIGGSTPMQHWNQGDGDDTENLAKVALHAGGVDVLTMSPNAIMPEEGIDLFADLLMETNHEARLLVQHSWSAWDGNGRTPSVGGTGAPDFDNPDRDLATVETIQGWIDSAQAPGGYLERMRAQLQGINERSGHTMAYLVPSATAVYRLRQEVLDGNVPGIERQSQLFIDPIGHPARPVVNLVTYVWFTVMYRQPAAGLVALVDPNDPTSLERERVLQRIAWETVLAEPMSGLIAEREPARAHH